MLRDFFGRVFNTVAYQTKRNEEKLALLQTMKKDLHSPSLGIVPTSSLLYNFLTNDYEAFSLKQYKDLLGVMLYVHTNSSSDLDGFVTQVQQLNENQYLDRIKSMSDYFTAANMLFGDWYDNDDSINVFMQDQMPRIIKTFLFYHGGENETINDSSYQSELKVMETINKRYPGLYGFVQLKDYRVLLSETLNILIAIHTINQRSLGETS